MSDTPDARVSSPRDGSSARYALLFCEAAVRPGLLALNALRSELDGIVFRAMDDSVRSVKLAWWGEEVLRVGLGAARHPVTRQLQAYPAVAGHPALLEYVESARTWPMSGRDPIGSFSAYCEASGGALAEAASLMPGAPPDSAAHKLRQGARALGAAIRATALARLALVSPWLMQPPGAAGNGAGRSPQEVLLAFAAAQFAAGFATVPGGECPRQRPLLIMAKLYERLLPRLVDAPAGRRIELGPMAKLWIAWSTARAVTKGGNTIRG